MNSVFDIQKVIRSAADPKKGVLLQRFFKTGEGEYGYGDVFLGLTVPKSRLIAKQFKELPLDEVIQLLHSEIHEDRLIALVILTMQYKKGSLSVQKTIYDRYLANTKYINNWDLVDLSAGYIVGEHLYEKARNSPEVLRRLAQSQSIWERRIAIISTFAWIKKGEVGPTFAVSEVLLHDKQDLIHKAVGWMLREVGKRVSEDEEERFLKERYKTMPRTMLRYAIERFPEKKRKKYLLGEI